MIRLIRVFYIQETKVFVPPTSSSHLGKRKAPISPTRFPVITQPPVRGRVYVRAKRPLGYPLVLREEKMKPPPIATIVEETPLDCLVILAEDVFIK